MRSIWHSLAWKEWHEHKWSFVSILAILGGVVAFVAISVDVRSIMIATQAILWISVVPLAVFVGMGTAASERSRGTMQFLQALPVPPQCVAWHKLIVGLLTAYIPFLLIAAVSYGLHQLLTRWQLISPSVQIAPTLGVGRGNWLTDTVLVLAYLAGSFFLWTVGTSVNRRDEVSAGAVALSSMVGWALILMLVFTLFVPPLLVAGSAESEPSLERSLAVAILSTAPGGLVAAYQVAQTDGEQVNFSLLLLGVCVATAVHVAFAARYLKRFGQLTDLEIRSPMSVDIDVSRKGWLGPPRRSELAAIVWKQFRESGPIALAGIAGIVALFALFYITNRQHYARDQHDSLNLLIVITMTFGFAIATVLGVGVFRTDVSPRINSFWRSRPIHPDLWFWSKFACGLVLALATIYLPILLWSGPDAVISHPDLKVVRLAHVAMFAAAVAMICLVRQTVYAAILSIALVYLGIVAVSISIAVYRIVQLGRLPNGIADVFELTESQVAAGLMISFVASTILAWLAVRNDWGQKSVRERVRGVIAHTADQVQISGRQA